MQPKAYSPLQPPQSAPGSTPGAPSGPAAAPTPQPIQTRRPPTMSEVLPTSYRTAAASQPAQPQVTTQARPMPTPVVAVAAPAPAPTPASSGPLPQAPPAPPSAPSLVTPSQPSSVSPALKPSVAAPISAMNAGNSPTALPPINPLATLPPNTPTQKPLWFALRGFISFFGFVASVIVLATLINVFVFQSYYVDGTSMTPTLQPDERLIINKLPQSLSKASHSHYTPRRGEIIVFNSELISPVNGKPEQLIKRVIGLPGERVMVKDGKITVYNQEFSNGFNPDEKLGIKLAATDGDIDLVVPDNHFFVCGDNRAPGGSYDSRYELGTVPSDRIVGELLVRLVPLNKAKIF